MIRVLIILFCFLSIILGCDFNQTLVDEKNNDFIIETITTNDSLLSIIQKRELAETSYYKNGKVNFILGYNLARQNHGVYKSFFKNGKVKTEGRFFNDSQIGNWYYYNIGGLYAYQLYDSSGSLAYSRMYKKGKLLNEDGKCAAIDTYKVKNSIKFEMSFANLPGMRYELTFKNYSYYNSKMMFSEIKKKSVFFPQISIMKTLPQNSYNFSEILIYKIEKDEFVGVDTLKFLYKF